MSDFNDTHYPTARREHRCEECGRTIGKGERYSRTAAVWWGDFFTNVACLHCAVARFIVRAGCDYFEEEFYGGLAYHLPECGELDVWVRRLQVGVSRQWQRFDGTGLMDLPRNPWPDEPHPAADLANALGGAA